MSNDVLNMWTVYAHPSDYPNDFVARRCEVGRRGTRMTGDMFTASTLAELRALLPMGLICLPRQDGDEPHIVETWM